MITASHMATIFSISVLASFASGFLCLLVVGIKWASSVKRDLIGEEHAINTSRIICARCGTSFFENLQLGLRDVLCADCKWPVCSACALHFPLQWLCTACIKSSDRIMEEGECSLKDLLKRFPTIDQSTRKYGRKENDVKNLIEMLAENILGVSFENVNINCISNDTPYLDFIEKYEGVLSLTLGRLKSSIQLIIDGIASIVDDSPWNIEKQLRTLIHEIITDASYIDPAKVSKMKHSTKFNIASKTYEEILAIAMLNKIIENVASLTLEPKVVLPVSDSTEKFERDYLSNIKLDAKIRELTNCTSHKNSWNKQKFIFPDLGFEIPQVICHEPKWEDNWLFRRKSRNNASSTPECKKKTIVPMFIPSPINYVSPQIGEASVDDISDLSDLSDSEIEQLINES